MTDLELLKQYAQTRSEAAFGELVHRHLDWVYSAAARQVQDRELAEDVAQGVFLALARQAKSLGPNQSLSPWLLGVTRCAAISALRAVSRRQRHEQKAAMMRPESTAAMTEREWEELAPLLDEGVLRLGKKDREAVLLRFYERKSFAEVGAAMGVSEEAAKQRVQRAVEKLREVLAKKGMLAGAGALGVVMTAKVTEAAPAGLMKAATAAAGGGGAGSAGVIAKGAIKMMVWVKLKVAAMVVMGAGLSIGGMVAGVTAPTGPARVANASTTQPVAIPVSTQPTESATSAPADQLVQTLDPEVRQLIAVIRENEARYEDIEFSYRNEHTNTATDVAPVKTRVTEIHAIYQGSCQWSSETETDTTPAGKVTAIRKVAGFDGKMMRLCQDSAVANIGNTPLPSNLAHPFRLVNFNGRTRLSAHLEGEMVEIFRRAGYTGTEHLKRLPDEQYLGLPCIVIEQRVDLKNAIAPRPTRAIGRDVLWICPERNYLPLRHVSYQTKDGREELAFVCQVEELAELSPGVFFPKQITSQGRGLIGNELTNHQVITFADVRLKPNYGLARFGEVPIPEGALLYVVKDGQIVASMKVTARQSVADAQTLFEEACKKAAGKEPSGSTADR